MALNPKVTVLVSTYNCARYLREALDSVWSQSFRHFELILVDDGSTDDSAAIYETITDPRLRVLRQPNQGLARALARGLGEARGEYVARLDPDDRMLPERLARQVEFLDRHTEVGAVGSQLRLIDDSSRGLGERRYATEPAEVRRLLESRNPLAHPATMFRRELALRVGGYRPDFPHAEDYDLWLRMAAQAELANLSDTLTEYRIHSAATKARQTKAQLKSTMALRKHAYARGLIEATPRGRLIGLAHGLLLLLPAVVIGALFRRLTYRPGGDSEGPSAPSMAK